MSSDLHNPTEPLNAIDATDASDPTDAVSLHEVIVVGVPDNKEALYIDGKLICEDRWFSAATILGKLIERGVIRGGQRYADKAALNDVGQFPRQLGEIAVRERMYS